MDYFLSFDSMIQKHITSFRKFYHKDLHLYRQTNTRILGNIQGVQKVSKPKLRQEWTTKETFSLK